MNQRATIGKNLHRILKELDVSSEELGRAVGLKKKTIESYEYGERMPKIDKLEEMRKYLVQKGRELHLEDFFFEEKQEQKRPYYCTVVTNTYVSDDFRKPLYEKGVYFKDAVVMRAVLVEQFSSTGSRMIGGMLLGLKGGTSENNLVYKKASMFIGSDMANAIAQDQKEKGTRKEIGDELDVETETAFRDMETVFAKLSSKMFWTQTLSDEMKVESHLYSNTYSDIASRLAEPYKHWLDLNVAFNINAVIFSPDISDKQVDAELLCSVDLIAFHDINRELRSIMQ